MSDLIKGLIYVRDPLTLFALLSLVFLVAFQNPARPGAFLRPCWEKLTREHFSSLLAGFREHRQAHLPRQQLHKPETNPPKPYSMNRCN